MNGKEDEYLVFGSKMQIIDVYFNGRWHKHEISALKMFEQITNGHLVNVTGVKMKAKQQLVSLLNDVTDEVAESLLRDETRSPRASKGTKSVSEV